VHPAVGVGERVAGRLHQFFLEGEVRLRVVDQVGEHLAGALRRAFGQLVDHRQDAPVLLVDDIDAGVEFVLPGNGPGHAASPPEATEWTGEG